MKNHTDVLIFQLRVCGKSQLRSAIYVRALLGLDRWLGEKAEE